MTEVDVDTTAQDGDETEEITDVTLVDARQVQLPEGFVSPIGLLNHLQRKGKAPKDMAPQRMYGYVKNPGKDDPFPVVHFDAAGNQHQEAQKNSGGMTYTKPGVHLKTGVAWWDRAGERQKARDEKKAEKAKAKEEKEKAKAAKQKTEAEDNTATEADVEPTDGTEFVEAEEAQ